MERNLVKTAMCAAVFLVAVVWAGPGLAEDCTYHKFTGPTSLMEEPLPGFDVCYQGRVRGTLNGQVFSCFYVADFWASDWLWGDGNYDYFVSREFDLLETSKGTIEFLGRAVYDIPAELSTGLFVITGGTGEYEGATGKGQFYNKYPNRLEMFIYEGRICTP